MFKSEKSEPENRIEELTRALRRDFTLSEREKQGLEMDLGQAYADLDEMEKDDDDLEME